MTRSRSVVIDCGPESLSRYRDGYAIVSVDVFRATTTAVTAVATGRRCFPASSLEMVHVLAARLNRPLLVGELGGHMPCGFDMNNSPAALACYDDVMRPVIPLSSSGTPLITRSVVCDFPYVACFRNYGATVSHLARHHAHVALLGAETKQDFREEDQMCCAWIAEGLTRAGYEAENDRTLALIRRWTGQPLVACAQGKSGDYLRRSGQTRDIEFVVEHQDDLDFAATVEAEEVVRMSTQYRSP